jgi:hypothetical protein
VGSELLVDLLSQHPEIAADSEILSKRRAMPNRFVAHRAVRSRGPGVTTYGYKLILEQLRFLQPIQDPRGWLSDQVDQGTTLITLERRNLLHQAISFSRAGVIEWHHTAENRPPDTPIWLDPLDVAAHLYVVGESMEWYHEMISGLPAVNLTYEDDLLTVTDQQRTAETIFNRLGLPLVPVEARLVRTGATDPSRSISNFDNIAAIIRESKYAGYLDADADADTEADTATD